MVLKKIHFILLILVVLHLLIRVYKLTIIPYGFHRDEAFIGYNAYSILKTGRDEWGTKLPLFSRSFGDYPPALVLYATIPFVWLLGLNEFSIRLSVVCFSLINFLLIYKILNKLKINRKLTWITLGLIAVTPWEITQVRGASGDPILGIVFFLTGIYCLINYFQKQKLKQLIFWALTWILSIFSYNSFRLFIPLFIPAVFLFFHKYFNKHKLIAVVVGMFLLLFPFLLPLLFTGSGVRNQQTLFIYDQSIKGSLQALSFQAGLMHAPLILVRIFHNKISYLTFSFLKNFIQLTSVNFLYLFEAFPRRFSVPENGLLLYVTLPFLILGLIFFSTSKIKNRYKYLLLYLFLVGLLPGVITTDDFPNSKRSFLAFYPLIYLIAIGIYQVYKKVKLKKLYLFITFILFCLNFGYFWFFYEVHSSFLVAHSRNYFYKQIAQVINSNYDKYNRFSIYSYSEAPYILMLFFNKFDPAKYQSLPKPPQNVDIFSLKQNWGFDKYYFIVEDCPLPKVGELIFAEYSKCKGYFDGDDFYKKIEILGYAYSPHGSIEFVYYKLK